MKPELADELLTDYVKLNERLDAHFAALHAALAEIDSLQRALTEEPEAIESAA